MTTVSLSDSDFRDEIRDALAGLDSTKVPDDTIDQTKDKLIEPLLDDLTSSPDQDLFDNAAIYWTAEKAFDAWLTFTRLRDREIETFIDAEQYRNQLKERTDNSLFLLDVTRPPQIPNTVVTIKHDGEKRRVNLEERSWAPSNN